MNQTWNVLFGFGPARSDVCDPFENTNTFVLGTQQIPSSPPLVNPDPTVATSVSLPNDLSAQNHIGPPSAETTPSRKSHSCTSVTPTQSQGATPVNATSKVNNSVVTTSSRVTSPIHQFLTYPKVPSTPKSSRNTGSSIGRVLPVLKLSP